MSRPREFNTDEALEQALQVFWSKGYEATSLCDLICAMGISKSSFYDTFGSKRELFLSAIDRYDSTMACRLIDVLEGDLPGLEAIDTVFRAYLESILHESGRRGCFVGNCAGEASQRDEGVASRVGTCLARMGKAYQRALRRAQKAGDIPADRDVRALARFLNASTHGLQTLGKAGADRAVLDDVVRVTLGALHQAP